MSTALDSDIAFVCPFCGQKGSATDAMVCHALPVCERYVCLAPSEYLEAVENEWRTNPTIRHPRDE